MRTQTGHDFYSHGNGRHGRRPRVLLGFARIAARRAQILPMVIASPLALRAPAYAAFRSRPSRTGQRRRRSGDRPPFRGPCYPGTACPRPCGGYLAVLALQGAALPAGRRAAPRPGGVPNRRGTRVPPGRRDAIHFLIEANRPRPAGATHRLRRRPCTQGATTKRRSAQRRRRLGYLSIGATLRASDGLSTPARCPHESWPVRGRAGSCPPATSLSAAGLSRGRMRVACLKVDVLHINANC